MRYLFTDEKTGFDYFCSADPATCIKKTCKNCRHLKHFCGTVAGMRRYMPPVSYLFFSTGNYPLPGISAVLR